MSALRRHPVACFLLVTYAVTWGAWLPLVASGHRVTVGLEPGYLVGLLGPMVGALVTTAITSGRAGLRALLGRFVRVRVGARWWLVALGVPFGVAAVAHAASLFLETFGIGHLARDYGAFDGFPLANPVALWVMLVIVNGFGEEAGWRGYLLPELQRRRSPLASSLIVGGCWALWHVPALFVNETYRLMPVALVPVFFVGIIAGSVFLAWLHNHARNSILVVAVWHGTYNLLSGSVGARGTLAALETIVVIVVALVVVMQELRELRRTGRPGGRGLMDARAH